MRYSRAERLCCCPAPPLPLTLLLLRAQSAVCLSVWLSDSVCVCVVKRVETFRSAHLFVCVRAASRVLYVHLKRKPLCSFEMKMIASPPTVGAVGSTDCFILMYSMNHTHTSDAANIKQEQPKCPQTTRSQSSSGEGNLYVIFPSVCLTFCCCEGRSSVWAESVSEGLRDVRSLTAAVRVLLSRDRKSRMRWKIV